MSFNDDVKKIRNSIKRYSTQSLLTFLLKRLHSKKTEELPTQSLPWISCLMVQWTLEIEPSPFAREAKEQDVYRILDDIWKLQSKASNIKSTNNFWLSMRMFFIQQLKYQENQTEHGFFLIRLYTLLFTVSDTPRLKELFYKSTKVSLEDFFVLSLFFYTLFMRQNVKNSNYVSFKDIITLLVPAFSIEVIINFLKAIGSNGNQLKLEAVKYRRESGDVKKHEYFSESYLLKKPLIISSEGVTTAHTYIATIGISEFVLKTLKDLDEGGKKFRLKFTQSFEKYIGLLLDNGKIKFTEEKQLKELYKKNKVEGKVVDFLIQAEDKTLFIDAKGVEPHKRVQLSDNPKILKQKLRDNLLSGIEQSNKCSKNLEQCDFPDLAEIKNRYALIVTHQDFYLGDGVKLSEYLGEDYSDALKSAVGDSIYLQNVFFMGVADFEWIVQITNETNSSIFEFLEYCKFQQRKPETSSFHMSQLIQSYAELKKDKNISPVGSDMLIKDYDSLFDKLESRMRYSETYWREIGSLNIYQGIKEYYGYYNQLRSLAYS